MKADWATAATDRAAAQGSERSLWAGSRWVRACVWLLLATGLAARLSPLLDVQGRLYWMFLSEDGYLMQTIARNMALGLGMSTAHGTIPTNGVQPLATFLYAGLHALAGGSKMLAIGYVTVFATAVSAAAAWGLWRLGQSVLRDLPYARDIALLAAVSWFASPAIIAHSMNGLETAVYYLAITIALLYYFSLDLSAAFPMRAGRRVALGLLLGVAFLARNDAVFFIAAVLAAHVLLGGASAGGGWGRRAGDAAVAGGLSLVVASPWLIYNKLMFGSVVPISGLAESHSAGLGANLRMIPANLVEASLLYVPIPRALETVWPVIVVALVVLAGLGWAAWSLVARRSLRGARFCVITLVFSAFVAGYYGLFFGAAWFVSRYLSALSPLLWLLTIASVYLLLAGLLRGCRSHFVAVPRRRGTCRAPIPRGQIGRPSAGGRLGAEERRRAPMGRRHPDRHARLLSRPHDQSRRQGQPEGPACPDRKRGGAQLRPGRNADQLPGRLGRHRELGLDGTRSPLRGGLRGGGRRQGCKPRRP